MLFTCSYTNYGTGARHCHVQDILNSSLQFVQSTPPTRDNDCCDIEMQPMVTDSPRSHGLNTGTISDNRVSTLRPAPRHVSQEELDTIETCLKRWRTEVEQDVKGTDLL
jgi:ubiquitin carboxyl-terminal hydrolase 25/28